MINVTTPNFSTPNFSGRNIILYGNKGEKNIKNPLLFNQIPKILKDFQTTIIYRTGENTITIPEASDKIVSKLLVSGIDVFEKNGKEIVKL